MSLDPRSDAELLAAFAANGAEAPFAELVRRHTPMVLGVCRRVLGPSADAEDAAQAVFLTLARKASSLRRGRGELAGWLHRVAWNASQNARRSAERRRAREREAVQMAIQADPGARSTWEQVAPLLDQELAALPDKYRTPLILHHLEGVPHHEAARRVGCGASAYASRLSRAREKLRNRLARRGVAVTVGALAAALSVRVTAAEVPAAFVAATAKAGAVAAAGGTAALAGTVSATAVNLAEGALHALAAAQLKTAALAASAALLLPLAGYVTVESLKNGRPAPIPGALAYSIPPERRAPAFSVPLYTGRILPPPMKPGTPTSGSPWSGSAFCWGTGSPRPTAGWASFWSASCARGRPSRGPCPWKGTSGASSASGTARWPIPSARSRPRTVPRDTGSIPRRSTESLSSS